MRLTSKATPVPVKPAAPPVKQPRAGSRPDHAPLWAKSGPIQFSLKVNQPGDRYEQEADRAADQVMRMPEGTVQRQTCACGQPMGPDGMCAECRARQEEHEPEEVQRMNGGEATAALDAAPPAVSQTLDRPGRPLDSATRHFMESRFGHDFGHVRVHTDGLAAASAEAVNARAYTHGGNVVFNQGQYRPYTAAGQRLLAHELAHVLQQSGRQTAAAQPALFRKEGDQEESTRATHKDIKAQQVFWDDLRAFFPNEGRKLAGSGYDAAVAHLEVSFLEGLVAGVHHSAPAMIVGMGYMAETDADKRKAWIKAELDKINKWRVETGRIDDQDVGDAEVTKQIDALDLSGKLDVLRKMEARKAVVANAKMQESIRNRIHSTPLMAGAVTQPDGSFELQFENVKIVVKPDVFNSARVASGAETRIDPVGSSSFRFPGYRSDARGQVSSITFTPTVPQVTYEIQTHYAPGSDPNAPSGYGVGTRPEDVGEQKKLRFHEGSHGSVFIREVKANIGANSYPVWQGQVGQTRTEFERHLEAYRAGIRAFSAMLARATETSTREVDCAGSKTIVQYHREHRTTTTVRCQP